MSSCFWYPGVQRGPKLTGPKSRRIRYSTEYFQRRALGSRTPVFSRRDIYQWNNHLKISPTVVRFVLSIAVSVVIHQRYIAVSVVIHQRSIAVSVVIHQRLSIQRKVQCDDIGDELVRYSNGFKSWCARLYKIYMKIPVYNIYVNSRF